MPEAMQFAPLVLGLAECGITISKVRYSKTDSNGDMRVHTDFVVKNKSGLDWHRIDMTYLLLDGDGRALKADSRSTDQRIPAGKSVEMSGGIGSFAEPIRRGNVCGYKSGLIGRDPLGACFAIRVRAFACEQKVIGEYEIPADALVPQPIPDLSIDGLLQMTGGMFWRTEPDEESGVVFINSSALVQNLSGHHFPHVGLVADVRDRHGFYLSGYGGAEQVMPGGIELLSGSTQVEDEKTLDGAKVSVAVRLYRPVAEGMAQQQGPLEDPTRRLARRSSMRTAPEGSPK